ncbi:MAG TPA: hypothetical protein VIQ31_34740 [Phormidium sp.]
MNGIITQALTERLSRGYVDDYCYDLDEWRLLKVGVSEHESSLGRIFVHYALVEMVLRSQYLMLVYAPSFPSGILHCQHGKRSVLPT